MVRAPDPDDRLTDLGPMGSGRAAETRRPSWWIWVAIAVVVAVGAAGVLLVLSSDEASAGEVILEPAAADGADPFFESIATTTIPVDDDGLGALPSATFTGDTPGLYGGTGEAACDPAALVGFLEANEDKAAAFAQVLDITVDGIGDYITTLTPVVLREDTQVTNHGYRDGTPIPRQSVLQAGTAVFVDQRGVPRVRCACGNALAEPADLDGTPDFLGDRWGGFSPGRVITVIPSGDELTQLELVDLTTGQPYTVPTGARSDGVNPASTTTTTPPEPADLVLAADGLGVVTFGQPGDDVRAVLTERLGPPTDVFTCAPPVCSVHDPNGDFLSWPGISVFIGESTGQFEHYSTNETTALFAAATPEGVAIGSRVDELFAAYSGLQAYECDFETYEVTETPATPGSDGFFIGAPGGQEFRVEGGRVVYISNQTDRAVDVFRGCGP